MLNNCHGHMIDRRCDELLLRTR